MLVGPSLEGPVVVVVEDEGEAARRGEAAACSSWAMRCLRDRGAGGSPMATLRAER